MICMAVLVAINGLYSGDLLAESLRGKAPILRGTESILIGDYHRRIRNQEMALQNKIDKNLTNALDNLENDPKAAKAALENLANKAVQADGIKGDVDIELYNSNTMTPEQLAEVEVLGEKYGKDEFGGFYDPESGKIYLNAAKLDGRRSQVSGILADELTHYVDHKKGRPFNQQRQDLSTEQRENLMKQFEGYNGKESVTQEDVSNFQNGIKKQDFSEGNENASKVKKPQPDIVGIHGGWDGDFRGTEGMMDQYRDLLGKSVFKDVPINSMSFKHGGVMQSDPDKAADLIRVYQHKDSNVKVMWGHSMGADAITEAFGSNPNSKSTPERTHEINLVMPRVNQVLDNLNNMSKNSDQVNIFMLSNDKRNAPGYGNRSGSDLNKRLAGKKIPSNVNIIMIDNYDGKQNHAGALSRDSDVMKQIWTQYKDLKGIKK